MVKLAAKQGLTRSQQAAHVCHPVSPCVTLCHLKLQKTEIASGFFLVVKSGHISENGCPGKHHSYFPESPNWFKKEPSQDNSEGLLRFIAGKVQATSL